MEYFNPTRAFFPRVLYLFCADLSKHGDEIFEHEPNETYFLGLSRYEPLYTVSQHGPNSSLPDLILHEGPYETRRPLAVARDGAIGSGHHSVITLPQLPRYADDRVQCILYDVSRSPRLRLMFEVEVGTHPSHMRTEWFKWKEFHNYPLVEDMFGGWCEGRNTTIYKLVRIHRRPLHSGDDRGQYPKTEPVLYFIEFDDHLYGYVLEFLFQDCVDVLGERFQLMAMMSALRISQKRRRERIAFEDAGY
ncbi:hypothetical protein F5Y15DRAFT_122228 [Xylariaceae sp. FL0016]|nr:hypothetical protein F5Y15DRAFT_122228 [Xylariaceae sp. FL0016]